MPRSNAPQALSVVAVTHEGDAASTADQIVEFDGASIPFNHDPTWNAMPKALPGLLDPAAVGRSLERKHSRVRNSIVGLFALGKRRPSTTFGFRDHPSSGLKEVEGLKVSPDVTIIAKSTCWRVVEGRPIIQLLQPRLTGLSDRQNSLYFGFARRAFCRGDWSEAALEVIDLSSADKDGTVHAVVIKESDVIVATEDDMNGLVATFLDGQRLAAKMRAERGPIEKKRPRDRDHTGDLFDR